MNNLQRAAGLATVLFASVVGTSAQAQDTKLRLHLWASPKHLINAEILPEWCKQMAAATQNRVGCETSFPPNAAPPAMFDRAKDGIADIAWGLHSYTPGRFLLSEMAELPGIEASSEAMSQAYWKTQVAHLNKADEHKGVQLLGLMLTTPGTFLTKFPMNSFDDLNGKKFRVPGGVAARVAERLGVVGVAAPATKVYEMLQQGVIDGALLPPETTESFRLKEVISEMTMVPGGLYYTSFFLAMNEDAFKKIAKADQEAIMKVSGQNYGKIAGIAFDKWDPIGIEASKKAGVAVKDASPALTAEVKKRTQPIIDAWIAEAGKKGVDGKAALDHFRAETAALSKK